MMTMMTNNEKGFFYKNEKKISFIKAGERKKKDFLCEKNIIMYVKTDLCKHETSTLNGGLNGFIF